MLTQKAKLRIKKYCLSKTKNGNCSACKHQERKSKLLIKAYLMSYTKTKFRKFISDDSKIPFLSSA